ncbi:MAG: tetratricopeptide repeat protein, partial [Candidatus Latescibacteria bacterium]|nr:tetratricopeptide repeat protein [Candidatus Latescibacterota bacterium]
LELYPKSKWVDDRLLLIGKAFYWREEYTDALTKFQELQENFPKSNLLSQTIYWQGLTLWAMDRNNEARLSFSFLDEEIDPDLFGLANLALAEMEATQGNYEDAVEAYKTLLELLDKKHDLRALVWLGVGNNLLELNRHDEALEAYENVLKSKPDAKTNFETRVKIGDTLEQQGKFDEALAAYEKILKIKRLRIYEAETQLKQANVYRLKDRLEAAEEIYNEISKKYPRSKYSASAFYRLGIIEQKARKDLEKAKELFEKAVREARSSEPGQLALQRQKDLTSLERYRKQANSAKDPQKALIPLFNLAELYLFNLGEPDSALVTYQKALSLADSSDLAPKARYAIGIIYADSLNNETAAKEQFQILLEQYANTPYAVEARLRLNQNRDDDALAEARFLEAESLKEEGVPAPDIAAIYQQIVDEYPQSLFAPQALFALAWTYENDLDQLEQAKSFYEQVRDQYPQTHYGEIAIDKLKGDFLKPYEPPAPEPEEKSQTKPAKTDTSDQNQTTLAPNTQEQTPQKPAFKPD